MHKSAEARFSPKYMTRSPNIHLGHSYTTGPEHAPKLPHPDRPSHNQPDIYDDSSPVLHRHHQQHDAPHQLISSHTESEHDASSLPDHQGKMDVIFEHDMDEEVDDVDNEEIGAVKFAPHHHSTNVI